MIERVSVNDIRKITTAEVAGMSDHDRDEMAIPSYLHSNPLIRWLMWRRYEVVADLIGDGTNQTALEFGCGMGLFLPELDRRFDRTFAVDLYPDYAMSLSDRRGLTIDFVTTLDQISDGEVDVIVAADVLEHVEDLPHYLSKFSAILKPGGRLIVSGPTENIVYKIGRIMAGFGDKGDYHHTNIGRLIDDITAHEFECVRTVRLPHRLAPTLFKVCEFKKA